VKRDPDHLEEIRKKEIQELRALVKMGKSIHDHPAQSKRQARALSNQYVPINLDREKRTAFFQGSEETVYFTSPSGCTCMDFANRRFPCKHMYRLMVELGEFQIDYEKLDSANICDRESTENSNANK
jgi:hypothetical protein